MRDQIERETEFKDRKKFISIEYQEIRRTLMRAERRSTSLTTRVVKSKAFCIELGNYLAFECMGFD